MSAEIGLELMGVKRGYWLVRPVMLMHRLGLRRLAQAIAERWVRLDVYVDGRYLFSVGLKRRA